MQNKPVRRLVTAGLLAGLVLGATLIRVVPSDKAYFNLGEAVIYAIALVFGRWYAGAAGAVGSALADLVSGYGVWAPITFIIKGVEGYVVGTLAQGGGRARTAIALLAGAGILIGGYVTAAYLMYGIGAVATELVVDLLQAAAGIVIGLFLAEALKRAAPWLGGRD
ncbi:MAG: ECF transporter S component [Bacillota bacterium]